MEHSHFLSSLRHPCAVLIALAVTSDGNAVVKPDITINSRALAWGAGVWEGGMQLWVSWTACVFVLMVGWLLAAGDAFFFCCFSCLLMLYLELSRIFIFTDF